MHSLRNHSAAGATSSHASLSTVQCRPHPDIAKVLGPNLPATFAKILLPHQMVGVTFLLRHMIGTVSFAKHEHSQSEAGPFGVQVPPQEAVLSEAPFQTTSTAKLGSGCLLSDYMGLGKTIQTIATLSVLFSTRKLRQYCKVADEAKTVKGARSSRTVSSRLHVTIVCPAPVVQGWCEECMRWNTRLDEVSGQDGPGGSSPGTRKRMRSSSASSSGRIVPSKFFVFRHDDSPLELLNCTDDK
jgi:SNF2 family DNA or RNA helicase